MRIVFNLHNVGLGNNGGSRTIIRCAEALRQLGADACVFSNAGNRYSWHSHSVPVLQKQPSCDVVIATGFKSVPNTLKFKAKKKFYYIRGFEKWVVGEDKLLASYKALQCIVNSQWLHGYLRDKGIRSTVVYPGLDFDDFYITQTKRATVLGGILHGKHKTKRHIDVIQVAKNLKCPLLLLNRDIKNASPSRLREFYNRISVWMSPSELEGLHNPPMEAALCGSNLVCCDHPRSGVSDYAIHGETALLYPARCLEMACEHVKQLFDKANDMNLNLRLLLEQKVGTRSSNMKKMIKVLGGK